MLRINWTLSTRVTLFLVIALVCSDLVCWFAASTVMQRDAQGRAVDRLETNMKVARDVLRRYGEPMRVEKNVLYAGGTALNGFNEAVDRVKDLVGGTATLFVGDKRVATNVTKPDGTRAVGTLLAKGPVYDAVLKQGRPFRGEAEILGTPFFTAYDPIFDAGRNVVGILYVGVPKADFLAGVSLIRTELLGLTSVLAVLVALATIMMTRRLFSPLRGIAAGMRALADGDASVPMPWASRGDDIGAMAKAVAGFQAAAIEKVRLERDAAWARRQSDEDRARNDAERAEASRQQARVVQSVAAGLERLSDGDLVFRLDDPFEADYEKLRSDFNGAVQKLQDTMAVVATNTSAIRSGTSEITTASDDLSRRTEQQAASLEETAAALDEITATVRKTSEGSIHAKKVVSSAKADAEHSGEVVRKAVAAMSAIETSSRQIGQIIGVIDEIAFQTNLLALNAGVEAARAGEAGRGFAVVASEVRGLAQRSAEAAKEIKALISASNQQVADGVELVGETGKALGRIVAQVADINGIVTEIAASTQDQAVALQQVNTAINQMDQVTQQNAAMMEESTAASHSLAQETATLAALIGRFEVGASGGLRGGPARQPVGVRAARKPTAVPWKPVAVLKTVGRGAAATQKGEADPEHWTKF